MADDQLQLTLYPEKDPKLLSVVLGDTPFVLVGFVKSGEEDDPSLITHVVSGGGLPAEIPYVAQTLEEVAQLLRDVTEN